MVSSGIWHKDMATENVNGNSSNSVTEEKIVKDTIQGSIDNDNVEKKGPGNNLAN